jgi:ubiquinone/menaquinone biosynthesis C-methylase UbiE
MSFPYNDRYWTDVAAFLQPLAGAGDKLLAPDDFWRLFPRIYRYINTRLRPEMDYDWAVIHKGQLVELAPEFARRLVTTAAPVFANEVFVVWSASPRAMPLPTPAHRHVQPLLEAIAAPASGPHDGPRQNVYDPVLSHPGEISQHEFLSVTELKHAMNAFWRNGGYAYDTERDQALGRDINATVAEFLGDVTGRSILDLCCGEVRLPASVDGAAMLVGADISETALRLDPHTYRAKPNFSSVVTDAHALAFASASFDIVIFIEAIEHVHRVPEIFSEVLRVLKPGGKFLVSTANTDSLHLIVTRKLGYPPFKTSSQHVNEFSFGETRDLLQAAGFAIARCGGIFLYPYWGVPGIDPIARPVVDNDLEFVALMRELGRRVGPEYSYLSVLLAEKP